jgi:hypothetical protein
MFRGCTKPYAIRTWTKAFGINVLHLSSRDGRSTADGRLNQVRLGDGNVRTGNGNIVRMKRLSKSGLIDCSDSMNTANNQTKQGQTGFLGNEIRPNRPNAASNILASPAIGRHRLTGFSIKDIVERPGSHRQSVLPAPPYSMTLRPRKDVTSHLHASKATSCSHFLGIDAASNERPHSRRTSGARSWCTRRGGQRAAMLRRFYVRAPYIAGWPMPRRLAISEGPSAFS